MAYEENLEITSLQGMIDYFEEEKERLIKKARERKRAPNPGLQDELNKNIAEFREKLRLAQERESLRSGEEKTPFLAQDAGEYLGEKARKGIEKSEEFAGYVSDKVRGAVKDIKSSEVGEFLSQGVHPVGWVKDKIDENERYNKLKWGAKRKLEGAKQRFKKIDKGIDTYFPTFRAGAGVLKKGVKEGVKTVGSGAKSLAGQTFDAGTGLVKIAVGGTVKVVSVGFWLLLTLALQVLDFLWLNFGGLDYKILLGVLESGGFELFLRLVLPFYVVIALVILLALKYSQSKKMGVFLLVLFVPLIIINSFATRYGFNLFGVSLTIISLLVSVCVLIYLLKDSGERYDFLSWVLLVLTVSLIISMGGLLSGLHHLIVAFLIWFFFLEHSEGEGWTRANYIISTLLIVDFFGFGIWRSFGPLQGISSDGFLLANRFVFPIWFLFVVFYSASQKDYEASVFSKFIMALVILFYIFALVDGVYGWATIKASIPGDTAAKEEAKGFYKNALDKLKLFPKKLVEEYTRGMEEATGGYYQGKVEKNKDPRNELGVDIDNLEAEDKEFYQNEDVVVWGDLKARTLDKPIQIYNKPIQIYMSCESTDGDGKKINGTITPAKLSQREPANRHTIQKLEEIPFECRFEGHQLKTGTNTLNIKAEFNFPTYGYLKTYLMSLERIRALRMENIDPLKQYGIDKTPTAIYTNGPVNLGMGTVEPPLGLTSSSDTGGYSYIGVTVQPQWDGRIKKINSLKIQLPKGMDISDPTPKSDGTKSYCRMGFEVDKSPNEDSEGNVEEYDAYDRYKLTDDELNRIKVIETYKSWRCPINIPPASVKALLGNAPVAVHYYRASVDYVYELEDSISVFVKDAPNEKRILRDCKTKCEDPDGCICDTPQDAQQAQQKCCIPPKESIGQGFNCDNDPSPANTCRGYKRSIEDIDNAVLFIESYLTLNKLCAQGSPNEKNEERISNDLAGSGFKADDDVKQDIKKLIKECNEADKKRGYIESGERKLVGKIEGTVRIFKNVKENLKKDLEDPANKNQINAKKAELIKKIEEVKSDFEMIKQYMDYNYQIAVYDTPYIDGIELAKTELEGIDYGE